ncbi:MAG TPA: hypothetical protein ENG03_05315 [Thioploca sp.]|nr:MAG: hypothetical protein DRQ48_06850 [Gammaproteobacteria bacterium]RKZ70526.1 MAG: hypothetical protein DRQ44_00590 [Gammaproteobacteria bacterium]HDN26504.1 hypothetical protein [Thioploca sp.]
MALDARYILDLTLEPVFRDKTTGLPLAGGKLYFYEDNNRNTLKDVFELSGSPPNYGYSPFPNPIILSSKGTIQDADENNVALYYYPYDSFDNIDLYYIRVTDANDVEQFTREAWPNIVGSNNPLASSNSVSNSISNSQFPAVLFDPTKPLEIDYTGAGDTIVEIAPDWLLRLSHSGAGTTTVTRTSIVGTSGFVTNPAYTLDITPGVNTTAVELIQRLENDTAIWGPTGDNSNGFVATSVTIAPNTDLTVFYRPSVPGEPGQQTLLSTGVNGSGLFQEFNNTAQLVPFSNTDTSDSGFVDIVFSLSPVNPSRLTSLQVVGLNANDTGIKYQQEPVSKQLDSLSSYYDSRLAAKAIPSHLVGWDFPANPAQFGAVYAAAAIGVNKSAYVWDQTIVFQSLDSGFNALRSAEGALSLDIDVANTQLALVQYLEEPRARSILNDRISVNIAAKADADVDCVVSLWYTDDATLPDVNANDSVVATLAADGTVATQNGSWNQVPRSGLGTAELTISPSATNNFNDYGLSGWDLQGIAGVNTATFFAIVVSTKALADTNALHFDSISLCSGDIATRPAPKGLSETLSDCERYYEKSYDSNILPGVVTSVGAVVAAQSSYLNSPNVVFQNASFGLTYRTAKMVTANTVLIYAPSTGAVASLDSKVFSPGSGTVSGVNGVANWAQTVSQSGVVFTLGVNVNFPATADGGHASGGSGWNVYHYVSDSRLGIV